MELERNEQLLTRWIDGELGGDDLLEFEKLAAADPQLRAAKAEADQLRELLKAEMPHRDIPNPEFFNSQIQRRIDAAAPSAAVPTAPPVGGGILSWFLSPFTLASAAAVIALGLVVLGQLPGSKSTPDYTSVASTYTPDKDIAASHFYSADAEATVIMLDGLEAMPDATELKGQNIVSAGPGTPGELYNEDRQLAFVVLQGGDSAPIVRSFH